MPPDIKHNLFHDHMDHPVHIQHSCRVSLYHTPLLRGAWKALMPQRYNETLGLQHTKIFVFDNSVILSGANLSDDYFTNRQDRYEIAICQFNGNRGTPRLFSPQIYSRRRLSQACRLFRWTGVEHFRFLATSESIRRS